MKKSLLPFLLVLAAFSLTYCSKDKKDSTTTTTTTTTATTPDGTATKTEVKTEVAGVTGVAECDLYISKYEKCINDKVPEAARGMLKQTLEQSRAAWAQAASTDAGKQTLAAGCTQALEAAKTSMGSYGCEF